TIYYLSDMGPEHRLNIWSYDTTSAARKQVTQYKDFDVKWPSMGPGPNGRGEIVFQNGPDLYLLDLATGNARVVEGTIPGDRPTNRPRRGTPRQVHPPRADPPRRQARRGRGPRRRLDAARRERLAAQPHALGRERGARSGLESRWPL